MEIIELGKLKKTAWSSVKKHCPEESTDVQASMMKASVAFGTHEHSTVRHNLNDKPLCSILRHLQPPLL